MAKKKKVYDPTEYLKTIPEDQLNPNHKEDFESLLAKAINATAKIVKKSKK